MPHISSKKLDIGFSNKLFNDLLHILGKAHDKKFLPSVFNELFTETEKIMFAKRVAVILMLVAKTPQHKIVDILKVSPTTVVKTSLKIDIGKYRNLLKISSKEKVDLEKLVWGILTAGGLMPPKVGQKYWTKNFK